MKISICSFNEVPTYYDKGVTHLVSIGGPGDHFPPIGGFFGINKKLDAILRLEFDDVDDVNAALIPQIIDSDFLFAKESDIRRLIRFIKALTWEEEKNAHILFHCHAGISRSTAAAFIALICYPDAYPTRAHLEYAWNYVFVVRPQANPNIWMIKLADYVLGGHQYIVDFAFKKLNLAGYNLSIPSELHNKTIIT